MPDIESLILVQTLLKLVWSIALGQDPLPRLVKPVRQEVMSHDTHLTVSGSLISRITLYMVSIGRTIVGNGLLRNQFYLINKAYKSCFEK